MSLDCILPVICEEVLGLLVQMCVHDVNEGGGPLQVLEVDVPEDPGVDDDMIFDIVIRHGDTAIPHFSLCDSHPVIVHLLFSELIILVQSLSKTIVRKIRLVFITCVL